MLPAGRSEHRWHNPNFCHTVLPQAEVLQQSNTRKPFFKAIQIDALLYLLMYLQAMSMNI